MPSQRKVYLNNDCALKVLESPCVYNIAKDELYLLDTEAFEFLLSCRSPRDVEGVDRAFVEECLKEGILVEGEGQNRRKVHRGPSMEPSLRYLEHLVTERCNLRCRHCYLGKATQRELTVENIKKGLDDFEAIGGLRVLVSGGEPMMHSQFWDINALLPGYSFRTVLLTNGLFIEDVDTARRLNFHEVQVSIDGIGPSHDLIRGTGTFERALMSVSILKDAGVDVSVATMAHRGNHRDFPRMKRLFEGLRIREWSIDVPCLSGYMVENRELLLNYDEAASLFEYRFGVSGHTSTPGYACGSHLMCVTVEGTFVRCGFFKDEPLGTIDEGLRKAWTGLHHWRLDELDCRCPHINDCRGGCRYRAYLHTGSLKAPDPLFCNLYRGVPKGPMAPC